MKLLSANEPKGPQKPADDTTRTFMGLGRLVDSVTPWLMDLGSWTFGALIAFNLVILGALLTVGPVDPPVKIATAAFAVALPLGVGGLVLLRLLTDMSKASLGDAAAKAFIDVGFRFQRANKSDEGRPRRVALLYTYALLTATALMTLTGMTASLWHMAWWIGVTFIVVALVSQVAVGAALSAYSPQGRWRAPSGAIEPETES
jgi:hypothetical protein